jgi:hypothetical protein
MKKWLVIVLILLPLAGFGGQAQNKPRKPLNYYQRLSQCYPSWDTLWGANKWRDKSGKDIFLDKRSGPNLSRVEYYDCDSMMLAGYCDYNLSRFQWEYWDVQGNLLAVKPDREYAKILEEQEKQNKEIERQLKEFQMQKEIESLNYKLEQQRLDNEEQRQRVLYDIKDKLEQQGQALDDQRKVLQQQQWDLWKTKRNLEVAKEKSAPQSGTVEWNRALERYEYKNSNGVITGIMKYNPVLERWEYEPYP